MDATVARDCQAGFSVEKLVDEQCSSKMLILLFIRFFSLFFFLPISSLLANDVEMEMAQKHQILQQIIVDEVVSLILCHPIAFSSLNQGCFLKYWFIFFFLLFFNGFSTMVEILALSRNVVLVLANKDTRTCSVSWPSMRVIL